MKLNQCVECNENPLPLVSPEDKYFVFCPKCDKSSLKLHNTKEKAAKEWNKINKTEIERELSRLTVNIDKTKDVLLKCFNWVMEKITGR